MTVVWFYSVSSTQPVLVTDLRLDGSADAPSEILEQGSHDRPLVAQTYSAAVTKGKPRRRCCEHRMKTVCENLASVCLTSDSSLPRLLRRAGRCGGDGPGRRPERPAPGGREWATTTHPWNWLTADGCIHQSEGFSGAAMNMWHKGGKGQDQRAGRVFLKRSKRSGACLSVSLCVRLSTSMSVSSLLPSSCFLSPQFRLCGPDWSFACTRANR